MERGGEVILYKARLQSFHRVTKARGKMADDVANVDIIKCVALFYKLGAAPKDFIRKEKFLIKLPRSLYFYLYFYKFVINISSNLCVCEQPIRRQNLFVRWLLNGVIETICSVLKILWSL